MAFLPFSEYLPDQPDFRNPGSSNIINVVPKTAQSYGPVASLTTAQLSALAARCQGAVGARDSANNTYNFAGTASKLYEATSGSTTWADVSILAGYNCAAADQWKFAQFGDVELATQIGDAIQSFTLGLSSKFAVLSSSAPKARYIAISKEFCIVANTNDGVSGAKPQRVWWSAIGDPTNWPTPGSAGAITVQSDNQDIVGDHGWCTGLTANVGPLDLVVFFERAVYRAMYVGAPDFWGFWPATGGRGCPVPGSIQRTELGVIFVGPDDIYLYDGTNFAAIGNQKVAATFWATVDKNNLSRVCSSVDPANKLYYLSYPSTASGIGSLDSILVCNYGLMSLVGTPGRFSKIVGSDPIKGLNGEFLFVSTSFGYTADSADGLGFNTDTCPYGPDDPFWVGNSNILSLFDAATHQMMTFNGSTNFSATLETSEAQLIKNRRAIVNGCRPIINGGVPTVTPYTRNNDFDTAPVAGLGATANIDGFCSLRSNARYHRFRAVTQNSDLYTHASGIEVPDDMIVDGGMR